MSKDAPSVPNRWLIIALLGLLAAILFGTLVAVFATDQTVDVRWRSAGSLEDLRDREVLFVYELRTYVVADTDGTPIALIARSPQNGERVEYCATSGWFEDAAHGSKFDGLGRYAVGPAPRGLDRHPTVVRDGIVFIDPTRTLLGASRSSDQLLIPPTGPFCLPEEA